MIQTLCLGVGTLVVSLAILFGSIGLIGFGVFLCIKGYDELQHRVTIKKAKLEDRKNSVK